MLQVFPVAEASDEATGKTMIVGDGSDDRGGTFESTLVRDADTGPSTSDPFFQSNFSLSLRKKFCDREKSARRSFAQRITLAPQTQGAGHAQAVLRRAWLAACLCGIPYRDAVLGGPGGGVGGGVGWGAVGVWCSVFGRGGAAPPPPPPPPGVAGLRL